MLSSIKSSAMKKLIKTSIVLIVLFSTLFVIVSFTKSNSSKNEVLLVEVMLMGEFSWVYIYQNDKPTEIIKTETSEKMIIENAENFQKALQKLYTDGWRLEETNGEVQVQRYILTRKSWHISSGEKRRFIHL